MTAVEQEVLVLCDRNGGEYRYVTAEVHDVIGWWPNGSPAWAEHPEFPDTNAIVLDVIPKRQVVDDDWLEDDPRILRLIDIALTLNDIHRLASGRIRLGQAETAEQSITVAEAVLARVRESFSGDDVGLVLRLGVEIESNRLNATS
jgi:hypothetical protein